MTGMRLLLLATLLPVACASVGEARTLQEIIKPPRIHFDYFRCLTRHDSTGFPCPVFDPSNANRTGISLRNQEQFFSQRPCAELC